MAINETTFKDIKEEGKMFLTEEDLKVIQAVEDWDEEEYYEDSLQFDSLPFNIFNEE